MLDWRDGRRLRLADVATVSVERGDRNSLAVPDTTPASRSRSRRSPGRRIATLSAVRTEIGELREDPLAEMGLAIEQYLRPVGFFVNQALGLVGGNLIAGVILAMRRAVAVPAEFPPRSWSASRYRSACSRPCCVMMVTGHSLNVISIAGIAVGVGMTLDAATIVLESISRIARELGARPGRARRREPRMAGVVRLDPDDDHGVLPVIFMNNVEGHCSRTLALTISVAIAVSLIVAVTVLPVAAARWLKPAAAARQSADEPAPARRTHGGAPTARASAGSRSRGLVAPAALTWLCRPSTTCLRSSAMRWTGFSQFPPGMNVDAIEADVRPRVVGGAPRAVPHGGREEPAHSRTTTY